MSLNSVIIGTDFSILNDKRLVSILVESMLSNELLSVYFPIFFTIVFLLLDPRNHIAWNAASTVNQSNWNILYFNDFYQMKYLMI